MTNTASRRRAFSSAGERTFGAAVHQHIGWVGSEIITTARDLRGVKRPFGVGGARDNYNRSKPKRDETSRSMGIPPHGGLLPPGGSVSNFFSAHNYDGGETCMGVVHLCIYRVASYTPFHTQGMPEFLAPEINNNTPVLQINT